MISNNNTTNLNISEIENELLISIYLEKNNTKNPLIISFNESII